MWINCRNCGHTFDNSQNWCPFCRVKVIKNLADVAESISDSINKSVIAQITSAKVQLQLANENNTSNEYAFQLGYNLSFLSQFPNAFNSSIDENGQLKHLHYQAPFLQDRLIQSYNSGVWDRLRKEINKDLTIPNLTKEFEEQAYLAGQNNNSDFQLVTSLQSLGNLNVSTFSFNCTKAILNENSGLYEMQSPYVPSFNTHTLNESYIKGLNSFISIQNLPSRVAKRQSESNSKKMKWHLTIIYLIVFWLSMIFIIKNLWDYSGFIAIMVFLCSLVAIVNSIDEDLAGASQFTLLPIIGLLIFFVPYFCIDLYTNICPEFRCFSKYIYRRF